VFYAGKCDFTVVLTVIRAFVPLISTIGMQ